MLSNTAVPRYYAEFREQVLAGDIPICKEIEMEMNRIDALIASPGVYYDDQAVEGFIKYCERELTLTDGSDLYLLPSFKLWAEEIFGWYYFQVHQPWRVHPKEKPQYDVLPYRGYVGKPHRSRYGFRMMLGSEESAANPMVSSAFSRAASRDMSLNSRITRAQSRRVMSG